MPFPTFRLRPLRRTAASFRSRAKGVLASSLKKNGFAQTRQVGSHVVLVKNDLTITVPLHDGRDLGSGIILSILKDAKIERSIYKKGV